ncbi:hypothetical protein [Bosea sp. TAF32]|uniref:hypothetical protein n=1 Tax=Bosea sp. TAF32 TaxID=3237482 RepID=UPI003F900BC5
MSLLTNSIAHSGHSADFLSEKPIFVVSSFRTSSTWLWLKIRSSANAMAYCEIFHEALSTISSREAVQISASSWQSKHPLSAPYFVEFLPLLKDGGGVDGYLPEMAFERFIPLDGVDGELSSSEVDYIARLIEHARRCRKIPVLTCTRALGRAKAIKKVFDFRVVFLYRNIFHQWASYCQQSMLGNNYFIDTIDKTLYRSRQDPFLRNVSEWFHARKSSGSCIELFYTFLLMHVYLAAVGHDAADLTINATKIASDPQLNREAADQLSQLVLSPVDLGDAKLDFGYVSLPVISRSVLIDTIQQMTKIMGEFGISERAHQFAERAAEEALSEWERHEFFTRGLHSIQAKTVADLTDRCNAAQSEVDRLQVEFGRARDAIQRATQEAADRQAADHVVASAECAILQVRIEELTAERDALVVRLDIASREAIAAKDSALAEVTKQIATLSSERKKLIDHAARLTEEITAIQAELDEAIAARDQLAQRLKSFDADKRGGWWPWRSAE